MENFYYVETFRDGSFVEKIVESKSLQDTISKILWSGCPILKCISYGQANEEIKARMNKLLEHKEEKKILRFRPIKLSQEDKDKGLETCEACRGYGFFLKQDTNAPCLCPMCKGEGKQDKLVSLLTKITIKDSEEQEVFNGAFPILESSKDAQGNMFYSKELAKMNINNGYVENVEELKRICKDYNLQMPKYLYKTIEDSASFNARKIISNVYKDYVEDVLDNVDSKAINEMQTYLDGWYRKYANLKFYRPDYSKVIILE